MMMIQALEVCLTSTGNSICNIKMLPLLATLASTFILSATAFMCPSPDVCSCDGIELSCTCDTRVDVTLTAVLNFEIRHMSVKGCGSVTIPFGSMTHLPLQSIEIEDIQALKISPFAFAGVQNLDSLRIAHIDSLEIETYGFSGITNVKSIHLENVTCEMLQTNAFGGLDEVGEFRVSRSKFGTVETLAIYISNMSTFEVRDSFFRETENASFVIQKAEKMAFVNTEFVEINTETFSLSYVDDLSFIQCNFGVIHTGGISAHSLKTFALINSTVEELYHKSFLMSETLSLLIYTNNSFARAHNNSVLPESLVEKKPRPVILGGELVGNKFRCDCHLSWMLTGNRLNDYLELLNGSTCIGSSFNNISLSLLSPKVDKHGNCLSIDLTKNVVNSADETISGSSSPRDATISTSSSSDYSRNFFMFIAPFLWLLSH